MIWIYTLQKAGYIRVQQDKGEDICNQQRHRSACASLQADQGLCYSLIEYLKSIYYISDLIRLCSDCMGAQTDLQAFISPF